MNQFLIGLVGDSDIARWPIPLLPQYVSSVRPTTTTTTNPNGIDAATNSPCRHVRVSGHSGITLHQTIVHVKDMISTFLQQDLTDADTSTGTVNKFIVVCAGENDIGCGLPLSTSKLAFQSLLDLFHQANATLFQPPVVVHFIFLGPKLEPWLQHDSAARKSYIQMSTTFERLCHQQRINDAEKRGTLFGGLDVEYIHYINCLTMFCDPRTIDQPGALHGGKAIPDTIYFHSDQLHLSDVGYTIWKLTIEDKISTMCTIRRQK